MRRTMQRGLVAAILVALGWVAGRAQTIAPDFVIEVEAPVGRTRVTCTRGCTLAWVERGTYDVAPTSTEFAYGCSGGGVQSCKSGAVGGWLRR